MILFFDYGIIFFGNALQNVKYSGFLPLFGSSSSDPGRKRGFRMKRLFTVLLAALALSLAPVAAAAEEAGPEEAGPASGISASPAESKPEEGGSSPADGDTPTAPDEDHAPEDGENAGQDADAPSDGEDADAAPDEGEDTDGSSEDGEEDDSSNEEGREPITPGLETEYHFVYIKGNKDMVNPEGKLTRAEAASMIFSLLRGYPQYEPDVLSFTDVKATDWFAEPVQGLTRIGALKGYADGSFRPNRNISRAEFVVILSRFFPQFEGEKKTFSDVTEDGEFAWAYDDIAEAAGRGWISGSGDGNFQPKEPITRAQAIKIINRALGRSAHQEQLAADGNVLLFLDLPYTHWAYYEIMEAALPHEHRAEEGGTEIWSEYTVPAASRKPGNYVIGGEMYQVNSDGHFARNQTTGVLRFDDMGRYTTGDKALDAKLTEIVKKYTVEGDTNFNNYKRLHTHISKNYSYRAGSYLKDGQTGWELAMAKEMLQNGKGNCYRYAGLGAMLARKMGYQAKALSGYIDTGWGFVYHGWVEIEDGGKTLVCDPQQQFRQPNANLYMREYNQLDSKYRVKNVIKK